MRKTSTTIVKLVFLCVAIGTIVAVYSYVERENQQVEEFLAKDAPKPDFASDTPASSQESSDAAAESNAPVNRRSLPLPSAVRNELMALRTKLTREREAAFEQSAVPEADLTPEQSENLKALRRTLSRSLAGQYSRKQIHITVQAIREMLDDPDCPARVISDDGNNVAGLSWRVHLLPYIGEQELYQQFHRDESWDSPHNTTLLAQMPMLYRGFYDKPDATVTRLMSLDIPGGFAHGGQLRALEEVSDPESDTLALIIVGTKLAVPWTSPQDFTTTADTFRDDMNFMPKPTYWVGTVEGAALNVRYDGDFQIFRALMTIAGDEADAVGAMVQEKSQLMKSDRAAAN